MDYEITQIKSPYLALSSLVFTTNVATAYYTNNYLYGCLFFCLTLTSVMFHTTNDITVMWLDQYVIYSIFLYGAYQLYVKMNPDNRINTSIVVIIFLTSVFLYYYGYETNQYCFSPDKCQSDIYHSMVHMIGSIGHILIMVM